MRECTRELEDILEEKVRVRLVPTFGQNTYASCVEKSKHVCFDFDFDTVLLSLDDGEPVVDAAADITNTLHAIGLHAPNLLHAVEHVHVVNLPIVLSADKCTNAVSKCFEKTVERFMSSARFQGAPHHHCVGN